MPLNGSPREVQKFVDLSNKKQDSKFLNISLKIAHLYCLFLLFSYLCSPSVRSTTGLLTVGVLQQYLVSFSLSGSVLYYSQFAKRLSES